MAGKYISDLPKATVVDAESKFVTQRGDSNEYCDGLQIAGLAEGFLNNKITNCITKIPQDISLELSDGTLTLKSGSKVYVPNGIGVFNEVVLENDVVLQANLTSTYNTEQYTWCYNPTLNKIQGGMTNIQTASGTYNNDQYCMFYDTANNIIKYTANTGSTWEEGYSLPFCLTSLQNGVGLTSINQVFNGFGFIGNTIFATPGVEVLIPNGRNEDGSLKNILWKNTLVRQRTYTARTTALDIRSDGWFGDIAPTYNEVDNVLTIEGTDRWMNAGIVDSDSTGRINSLIVKNTFHAVDYSEYKPEIDSKLNKSGDTMTGRLTMGANDIYFSNPNGTSLHIATDGSNWDIRGNKTWLRFLQSFGITLRDIDGDGDFHSVIHTKNFAPDYANKINFLADGADNTAVKAGYVFVAMNTSAGGNPRECRTTIKRNGVEVFGLTMGNTTNLQSVYSQFFPVIKGDVYSVTCYNTGAITCYFIPLLGA